MRLFVWILAILLPVSAEADAAGARPPPGAPAVAGWAEIGWIAEPSVSVKMKLDTGAETSSIDAPGYRTFDKDGAPHAAFTITGGAGQSREIVRPVVRTAKIRRAGVKTRPRPVIRLRLCVAGVTAETEFTLADRSGLDYPVLVGRAFLSGRVLVDSSRTFIAGGLCVGE